MKIRVILSILVMLFVIAARGSAETSVAISAPVLSEQAAVNTLLKRTVGALKKQDYQAIVTIFATKDPVVIVGSHRMMDLAAVQHYWSHQLLQRPDPIARLDLKPKGEMFIEHFTQDMIFISFAVQIDWQTQKKVAATNDGYCSVVAKRQGKDWKLLSCHCAMTEQKASDNARSSYQIAGFILFWGLVLGAALLFALRRVDAKPGVC